MLLAIVQNKLTSTGQATVMGYLKGDALSVAKVITGQATDPSEPIKELGELFLSLSLVYSSQNFRPEHNFRVSSGSKVTS